MHYIKINSSSCSRGIFKKITSHTLFIWHELHQCGQYTLIHLSHLHTFTLSLSPWGIGNLKYLETEIEKRPSRPSGANWGQIRPSGTKLGQTGPNRAKLGWFFACKNILLRWKYQVKQPRPSDKSWPSNGDFVQRWNIARAPWKKFGRLRKDLWKSPQICTLNWRNVEKMFQMINNVDCRS